MRAWEQTNFETIPWLAARRELQIIQAPKQTEKMLSAKHHLSSWLHASYVKKLKSVIVAMHMVGRLDLRTVAFQMCSATTGLI
jgi:hypothetical protein